jgi:prepilin-type N-terminal cleavage/methylation domain-containing protein
MSTAKRQKCTVRRRPGRGRPKLGRDGFTLTEILVVLAILVIGILPLAILQSQARHEVNRSDRLTQASTLAQQRLEEMKGLGFGNAAPDSGWVGPLQWSTNVTQVALGLERLEVSVIWRDVTGPRTLQVADLISMR